MRDTVTPGLLGRIETLEAELARPERGTRPRGRPYRRA